jgi:ubiquinone/menaquinone biosynthesis C-methylase UbiE
MGFFSLPMAEIVGPSGRVFCVDMQERMIGPLRKRAARAGVSARISARTCSARSLEISDLKGQVDFALAYAVLHEVPDGARLLAEIADALAPGGRLLIAEPRGHVSADALEATRKAAEAAGLSLVDRPDIKRSRALLLEKPRAA